MKKNKIIIIICIIFLLIISIINIYNAKYLNTLYSSYFLKQFLWIIIGFIIFFILNKININKIFDISLILYICNIILLILVLIIGKEINGSKGWINLKYFSFQPSEMAKLTLTLLLINISYKKNITFKLFLKLLFVTLLPSFLVFIEPDTGAIIFYFVIFLTIIFCKSNKKNKIYMSIFIIFFILISTFLLTKNLRFLKNIKNKKLYYRINRVLNYKKSYQKDMALTNIYGGKIFRNGFNKILLYIPEGVNDFIFSFSIGNFGIFLFFIIILIYLIFLNSLLNLVNKYNDKKTNYLIISFSVMSYVNIIINILMNLGLIPIIGITLPFLSYGGSNMLLYFIYIAIIFNLTNMEI